MNKNGSLIVITKSFFTHIPELHFDELRINKLNALSDQSRCEIEDETKLGKLIRDRYNEGLSPSKEQEIQLWRNIFESILESKINVLNLWNSNEFKLPLALLLENKKDLKLNCVNLELDEEEFKRRGRVTLSKSKNSNDERINSNLSKYIHAENKRKKEILAVEKEMNLKFLKFDAMIYEKKIINELIEKY